MSESQENASTEPSVSILFKLAFEALGVTPPEVAKKIGTENAKIYNVLNDKFKPGYETVNAILKAYPLINANWLLKGQRPILFDSGTETADVADSPKIVMLPLLLASANVATVDNDSTYPVLTFNDPKMLADCVVVKLTDSSMLPRYPAGMRLVARPVKTADWEYLNSVLVLVQYCSTLVMRRIRENELLMKDFLTLYADSTDGGFVSVKRNDLQRIWQVVDIVGVDSLL